MKHAIQKKTARVFMYYYRLIETLPDAVSISLLFVS